MTASSNGLDAPWGTHRLGAWGAWWLAFAQRRRRGPIGRRLALWARKIALIGHGDWIDGEAEGVRIRAGRRGNVSDRKFLFMPAFVDAYERAALARSATDGGVFVDVGANAGVYALCLANAYRAAGGGRVIAVEPNGAVLPRLRRNVALNDFGSIVEIAEVALSDAVGSVTFTISSDNLGQSGVVREETGQRVTVPTTTLLKLLVDAGVRRVDGLKIDIEGAEDRVLFPFFAEAPDELLPRCVVIEDSRSTWDPALMKAFFARGYRLDREARMNLVLNRD